MRTRARHAPPLISQPRALCERVGVAVVLALVLAGTAVPRLAAAQTPGQPAKPAAVPIAEISQRAEEVATLLRSLERELGPSPQVGRIEHDLTPLSSRLEARFDRTKQTLEAGAELGPLDTLADLWQSSRLGLAAW